MCFWELCTGGSNPWCIPRGFLLFFLFLLALNDIVLRATFILSCFVVVVCVCVRACSHAHTWLLRCQKLYHYYCCCCAAVLPCSSSQSIVIHTHSRAHILFIHLAVSSTSSDNTWYTCLVLVALEISHPMTWREVTWRDVIGMTWHPSTGLRGYLRRMSFIETVCF